MSPVPRRTTWIAVADGAKAVILANHAADFEPKLEVVERHETEVPPSRELGSDKPGRMPDPGPGQRSAMERPDLHGQEKAAFVHGIAERLNQAAAGSRFDRLILAAPPKVLGQLRSELSDAAGGRVVREIPKDYANFTVQEIERQLAAEFGG